MQYSTISLVPDVALPYSNQVDMREDDSKPMSASRQSLGNLASVPIDKRSQPMMKGMALEGMSGGLEKDYPRSSYGNA